MTANSGSPDTKFFVPSSSPRTPTCQPTRNTRRSSRSPCALRVLSRRVRRMTPKRRKQRSEPVPSPEQDKAEVVRAVLTRREIGVVTSAAAETARDHRHATLLLWPGGRNPTAPTSTRPVDPDVVPTHGVVIVSEGSGDEVLRGEDVVAHKPVSTNCPPPLRPGPASSCLVTAIDCNETMRQDIDARLATLTTLAKAGQASWCSGEDWIQGGA